ncbi:GDSL-like lipase/acylhydrolase family protein [Nocardia tenerifensis]|uniref:GDSL-like lipase/acylhydrolase family protein n=1 Tax=Nocardia tenerifensis TaxID=228006 RepID=A0A318KHW6_9NOCA|nr:SGNH/GDSL hydrolase family protein [Nocardia tenerifensis]PXX71753.1 GDSL-like lipase/acylhydrolase family protein [Nocardia tenerifensis]
MIRARALQATLAALFTALLPAAVAVAAPTPAPADYAALGDSYSSGVGTSEYRPDSGSCLRSDFAYPALWAKSHPVGSFLFAACGGATTQDVRDSQLGVLSDRVGLVTLTIGGNDAGFARIVSSCIFPASDAKCDAAVNEGIAYANNTLPGRLDGLYKEIKTRAPKAKVVVLGYPRLFERATCPLSFSLHKRDALNHGADELDRVIAARAQAAGFVYANPVPRFAGHGICGQDPWINALNIAEPVESYHPDRDGQARGYLPTLNSATAPAGS